MRKIAKAFQTKSLEGSTEFFWISSAKMERKKSESKVRAKKTP